MDNPKDPIIIVGTGRCGSTALHRALSYHPDLAWLSGLNGRYPESPVLGRLTMRAMDIPILGEITRQFVEPSEAYGFWDDAHPGFSAPFRDLDADDVLPRGRERLRTLLPSICTSRRSRLLLKITGWPRLDFLCEVFPGAKFVHIYRDGRAVAGSLLSRNWWTGWRGPWNWKWGPLTDDQLRTWNEHDRSFPVLAGLQWEILMGAFQRSGNAIPGSRLYELRFEDVCRDPESSISDLLCFLGLDWNDRFQDGFDRHRMYNSNAKWRDRLGDEAISAISSAISATLETHGYDSDSFGVEQEDTGAETTSSVNGPLVHG